MCGPQIISEAERNRIAAYQARFQEVTQSPFGKDDEIGMLNLITEDSVSRVLSEIRTGKVFDLSVDYFMGMPNWTGFGDPPYQIWMTHTPAGSVITKGMRISFYAPVQMVKFSGLRMLPK